MSLTGLITRHASGLDRLDELLRWTYIGISRAYGAAPTTARWPALTQATLDTTEKKPSRRKKT
jgi:hypothetical protein